MYEWSDAQHSLPEPRPDLGADFGLSYNFSPGTVIHFHRSESCQIFFLVKVNTSSRSTCEGDYVSSCYNDEKRANGAYAEALFAEYCSIGDFTPHLKVHNEVCFCFLRSCLCFSRNGECARTFVSMWSLLYCNIQRITLQHRLRLLIFRRCSKKIRSHPRRYFEKRCSPSRGKKSDKIRYDEGGERSRGKNCTRGRNQLLSPDAAPERHPVPGIRPLIH